MTFEVNGGGAVGLGSLVGEVVGDVVPDAGAEGVGVAPDEATGS
ncbi:hypothetical protein ACIBQ6_16665 [Nonomuraea sp. NPDC049655]